MLSTMRWCRISMADKFHEMANWRSHGWLYGYVCACANSFSQALHKTRMPILYCKTLFWLCHSKLTRPMKSVILSYQLTSNFTLTHIICCKQNGAKLQISGIQSWHYCQYCQFLCSGENVDCMIFWNSMNSFKGTLRHSCFSFLV